MGFKGTGHVKQPKIWFAPVTCECNKFKHKTDAEKPIMSICPNCQRRYVIVADTPDGRKWQALSETTQDFKFTETGKSPN